MLCCPESFSIPKTERPWFKIDHYYQSDTILVQSLGSFSTIESYPSATFVFVHRILYKLLCAHFSRSVAEDSRAHSHVLRHKIPLQFLRRAQYPHDPGLCCPDIDSMGYIHDSVQVEVDLHQGIGQSSPVLCGKYHHHLFCLVPSK